MATVGLSFDIVERSRTAIGLRADRTAIIALTERGPRETPMLVHSHDEFVRSFGGPLEGTLGGLAAGAYYQGGGEELVVARFVPGEAQAAFVELPLVGASSVSSPVVLRARDPGAFGNAIRGRALLAVRRRLKATVLSANELAVPSAFAQVTSADMGLAMRIRAANGEAWRVLVGITSGPPQLLTLNVDTVLQGEVYVEIHEPAFTLHVQEPGRPDLRVEGLDLRDMEALNRRLSTAGLFLDGPAQSEAELPAPEKPVRLGGGDDGLAPSGDLDALRASFERCVRALEESELPDVLIAPDLWNVIYRTRGVDRMAFDASTASVLADELVHSAARTRDRVALVDPPLRTSPEVRPLLSEELEAWRQEREARLGPDRDFSATYYPWLRVVTDQRFRGDDTLLVPPSAHVAARLARSARERGPWIAAGNVALEGAVGLSVELSRAAESALEAIGIVPLRMAVPQGALVHGVRSLSFPDRSPWRYLSTRRLFNFLRRALVPVGLSYVFEPNTPATWMQLRRDVEQLLRLLFERGAFAGSKPSEAFFVQIDAALNPESTRDNGQLTARIGVAPAVPLEFLVVRLLVHAGIAAVTEEPLVV